MAAQSRRHREECERRVVAYAVSAATAELKCYCWTVVNVIRELRAPDRESGHGDASLFL